MDVLKDASAQGAVDNRIYDLQGRVVNFPLHGVYLVNGKKILR